ncbi:MAG: hypothetical protein ACRC28_18905 [Clostridium sp.]|uniref:hypothetical protein n=1 Tax=Clostridium sp. TaxID=1506 RepID=UPI003F2D8834
MNEQDRIREYRFYESKKLEEKRLEEQRRFEEYCEKKYNQDNTSFSEIVLWSVGTALLFTVILIF